MDPKKLIWLWVVLLHIYPAFLEKALLQHYHKAMMHVSITEVTSICSLKHQCNFQKSLTVLMQNRHWNNLHENIQSDEQFLTTGKCKTSCRSWKGSHSANTCSWSQNIIAHVCHRDIHKLRGKYLLFCYPCLLVKYQFWTVSLLINFSGSKFLFPTERIGARGSSQCRWEVFRLNYTAAKAI